MKKRGMSSTKPQIMRIIKLDPIVEGTMRCIRAIRWRSMTSMGIQSMNMRAMVNPNTPTRSTIG